ncbi:MAG TPA: hypothetical protein VN942_04010 [Chthoniobacterales bacterium]|nr:hypothetical protein [Chthoniobacterales bacterium]
MSALDFVYFSLAKQVHRVCHDTLPWLISFSLGRQRGLQEAAKISGGCFSGLQNFVVAGFFLGEAGGKIR